MKAREGDLLQTQDETIFDVKGLVHPPNSTVAFPRFIPDAHGNRRREDRVYRKIYALSERYKLLEKRFPQYLIYDPVFGERLCEVPRKDIRHYYNPVQRLQEFRNASQLDDLEVDAILFAEFLKNNSAVSWNKMGISGSLLVQLHTPGSDLDLAVYGEKACRKVCETLKSAMKDGKTEVKPYTLESLKSLYAFRSQDTKIPFNDFAAT